MSTLRSHVGAARQAPQPPATTDRVRLAGLAIDSISEDQCVQHVMRSLAQQQGGWIITPNLDHLRRARRDAEFRDMLEQAQLVVADGMPLIWASRAQGTPLPERVAGSSLVSTLAAAAATEGRSLFLLGGEPGAAEGAAHVLRDRYPGLRIVGTACPEKGFEHDASELERLHEQLRLAQPDIVYVALGSPKQERFIRAHRHVLPQAWWVGVGISLSFLCGQVRRAPRWMQRAGLEWVHRLVQEPGRLARRYLVEGLPFAGLLFSQAMLQRLGRRSSRRRLS